ncbi:hypothetical protein JOC83_003290 [Bacillus iocasae]|uniref:Uncharacterized protein n=1 Tax=Priestia iocasae TaxID=2291674 RepID=A0ABS2QYC9_9BACI|nr:hypothetical protein [Metabacillus iocasae]
MIYEVMSEQLIEVKKFAKNKETTLIETKGEMFWGLLNAIYNL